MKRFTAYLVTFVCMASTIACTSSNNVNTVENNSIEEEIKVDLSIDEKQDEIVEVVEKTTPAENEEVIIDKDETEDKIEKENTLDKVDNNDSKEKEETKVTEDVTPIKDEDKPKEIVVDNVDMTLYVKKSVNVRQGPSVDNKKIGSLNKGDQIHITGKTEDGWYRIEYNSDIAYANSGFFIDEEAYNKMLADEEAALKKAQEDAKKAEEEAKNAQASLEQEQQVANEVVNNGSFQSQVVSLCNQKRAEAGLPPLVEDATLDGLAQIRAGEIVSVFDHTRPDGSSCFTVLDGVQWNACGENIAAGQISPEEVVNAWMNSEGHRANILSPKFNKIGVGYVTGGDYGTYWSQLFTN